MVINAPQYNNFAVTPAAVPQQPPAAGSPFNITMMSMNVTNNFGSQAAPTAAPGGPQAANLQQASCCPQQQPGSTAGVQQPGQALAAGNSPPGASSAQSLSGMFASAMQQFTLSIQQLVQALSSRFGGAPAATGATPGGALASPANAQNGGGGKGKNGGGGTPAGSDPAMAAFTSASSPKKKKKKKK